MLLLHLLIFLYCFFVCPFLCCGILVDKYVVSASADGHVRVISPVRDSVVRKFNVREGLAAPEERDLSLQSISVSRAGMYLLNGIGGKGNIHIWDVNSAKLSTWVDGYGQVYSDMVQVTCSVLSANDALIVSGNSIGEVLLHESKSCKHLKTFFLPDRSRVVGVVPLYVRYSQEEPLLDDGATARLAKSTGPTVSSVAALSATGSLVVWDVATGRIVYTCTCHGQGDATGLVGIPYQDNTSSIANVHEHGQLLASYGLDGRAVVHDMRAALHYPTSSGLAGIIRTPNEAGISAACIAYAGHDSPYPWLIMFGTVKGSIVVFDLQSSDSPVATSFVHQDVVADLASSSVARNSFGRASRPVSRAASDASIPSHASTATERTNDGGPKGGPDATPAPQPRASAHQEVVDPPPAVPHAENAPAVPQARLPTEPHVSDVPQDTPHISNKASEPAAQAPTHVAGSGGRASKEARIAVTDGGAEALQDVVRKAVKEAMGPLAESLGKQLQNIHVDMIRQLEIQRVLTESAIEGCPKWEQISDAIDELKRQVRCLEYHP